VEFFTADVGHARVWGVGAKFGIRSASSEDLLRDPSENNWGREAGEGKGSYAVTPEKKRIGVAAIRPLKLRLLFALSGLRAGGTSFNCTGKKRGANKRLVDPEGREGGRRDGPGVVTVGGA